MKQKKDKTVAVFYVVDFFPLPTVYLIIICPGFIEEFPVQSLF